MTAFADLEAEQAVLGALLLDRDAVVTVRGLVDPLDFHDRRNEAVARAAFALHDRSEPIDVVTLRSELAKVEAVVPIDYVADLAVNCPSAVSADHYARLVRECSRRRRMQAVLAQAQAAVADPDRSLDEVDALLAAAAEGVPRPDTFSTIGEMLDRAWQEIGAASKAGSSVTGIPTGLSHLDRLTTGMHPGEMWVVGARPSLGKTTLGIQWGVEAAKRARKRVLIFSAEQGRSEIAQRILAAETGIEGTLLRRGEVTEVAVDGRSLHGFELLAGAIDRLRTLPLWVDDEGSIRITRLRARARWVQARHGLDLVIVDYLQLLTAEGRSKGRVEELEDVSRRLKALAKELRVPVVVMAQLNREAEAEGRPKLHHFKGCGGIEQDADVALLLHAEAERPEEKAARERARLLPSVEAILAKNRNGARHRTIALRFDGPRFRFVEETSLQPV